MSIQLAPIDHSYTCRNIFEITSLSNKKTGISTKRTEIGWHNQVLMGKYYMSSYNTTSNNSCAFSFFFFSALVSNHTSQPNFYALHLIYISICSTSYFFCWLCRPAVPKNSFGISIAIAGVKSRESYLRHKHASLLCKTVQLGTAKKQMDKNKEFSQSHHQFSPGSGFTLETHPLLIRSN